MNSHKGFTLIELLVVIAVIALLSAVVFAALGSARDRGANAAIKDNLNNVHGQAEIAYDAAGYSGYSGVCADTKVTKLILAATKAAGSPSTASCGAGNSAWAAWSPLKVAEGSNTKWCVDSVGNAKGEPNSATLTNGTTTVCP